ncbi:MAG: diacylglycerol kinase family protein [Ferruginibacter sp.]|nr:diacylglycerol kinase family protein [Ferruginibacter sp.]
MKLLRSFGFAFSGIIGCFKSELNFRIHIGLTILAVMLSIACNLSAKEWAVVLFCIVFVIAMEMFNTAVEKLCDIVHKEVHPGIKKVKDISAGAVLVSALFSLVTAAVVFLPKIITLIKSFYK